MVAIPTAIPDEPLTSKLGIRAGKTTGASEINFADTLGVIAIRSVGGVIVAGLSNHIRGFMLRDFSKIF